jgi:iron complex transport system permease protein
LNRPYLLLLALILLAALLGISFGAVPIPPLTLLRLLVDRLPGVGLRADWPETYPVILFSLRLPHVALVLLTGLALGGSGAAYQGLFRNPLADPYLIGVASGAGLGAVAVMALRWPAGLGALLSVPAAAFVGALLTVALVYALAYSRGAAPNTTLILAGVAVGAFASALTSFLMLSSQGELHRAIAWLLGGANSSGWPPVLAALPYVALSLGVLLASGHALNVLQFGEEQAQQLGLNVRRTKLVIILAASLATAAAIAFSGVIGFVGLIVPHILRFIWGSDYRRLLPLSMLGGGLALLLADLLARLVLAPQEVPLGLITALAGAPFFLWILRRAQQKV